MPPATGRTRRARLVVAVVAVVAVLALVAVGGAVVLRGAGTPEAGRVRAADLRLPEAVNAPGAWSTDEGVHGPLAAVGLSDRSHPDGLTGERQSLEMFGVSAVDGRSSWIHLPGAGVDDLDLVAGFALSPDGRWLAWTRSGRPTPGSSGGRALLGWNLMDTTTGRIRRLADPVSDRLVETAADLAFSGDSRYLLTSYERPHGPARRGHRFVAWDVRSGAPTVVERPGHYWLPEVGSAPSGVVWSRGHLVHRADVATGQRLRVTLPRRVVTASWGPNDRAFAYVALPARPRGAWRLYAGPSVAQTRVRPLPGGTEPREVLGWIDARHVVVVGHDRTSVLVDVVTGEVVERSTVGYGHQLDVPHLAGDLWRHPLVAAPAPEGTRDPRWPWRGAAGVVLAAFGVVELRRRRGADHPGGAGPDPAD